MYSTDIKKYRIGDLSTFRNVPIHIKSMRELKDTDIVTGISVSREENSLIKDDVISKLLPLVIFGFRSTINTEGTTIWCQVVSDSSEPNILCDIKFNTLFDISSYSRVLRLNNILEYREKNIENVTVDEIYELIKMEKQVFEDWIKEKERYIKFGL